MVAKYLTLLPMTLLALTATASPSPEATLTLTAEGQLSAILSHISTYETALTATDPKFTSVASVLETAIPSTMDINDFLGTTKILTTESWYKALPTDVKSYMSSIESAEVSLATANAADAGPVHARATQAAVAGIAGAMGAAALLL